MYGTKMSRVPLRESLHPVCELLALLPRLHSGPEGQIDLSASSPSVLAAVTEHAEDTCSAINRGMAAVGSLMAHSAPELEDGTIGVDAIEALGWLYSELGALAASCFELSIKCRRAQCPREFKG